MKTKTQKTPKPAPSIDIFVSGRRGATLLGIGLRTLQDYADRKVIGSRSLPGIPRRYRLADIEALAASVTTASVATAAETTTASATAADTTT
jgi:hypothetical protein